MTVETIRIASTYKPITFSSWVKFKAWALPRKLDYYIETDVYFQTVDRKLRQGMQILLQEQEIRRCILKGNQCAGEKLSIFTDRTRLQASYNYEQHRIYLPISSDKNEWIPRLIIEICNASQCAFFKKVLQTHSAEAYATEVEYIEWQSAKKTQEIVQRLIQMKVLSPNCRYSELYSGPFTEIVERAKESGHFQYNVNMYNKMQYSS